MAHAYYNHLAALLEPDALEAFNYGAFTYAVDASTTKYVLASFATRLGSTGRMEVRDPRTPMAIRNVTLTGLGATSIAVTLNPALPQYYSSGYQRYMDRLEYLATAAIKNVAVTAPTQNVPLLPGPYGAIITRVTNFDFTWLVGHAYGSGGWNMANEIGDTGASDYQRNDNALLMPVNKKVICEVASGGERTSAVGLGSVSYVLLPSTWSVIADPLSASYLFRDDFTASALDTTTNWTRSQSTVGNVEINTDYAWCKLKGNANWATNGAYGKTGYARATGRVFLCDVYIGRGTAPSAYVGWGTGAGVDEAHMAHGLLFSQTPDIKVKENGNNRGTVGTGFTQGVIYRVRITLLAGGGATYEIQGGTQYGALGSASWTDITPGTSTSATNTLYPAFTSYDETMYIGDVRVY